MALSWRPCSPPYDRDPVTNDNTPSNAYPACTDAELASLLASKPHSLERLRELAINARASDPALAVIPAVLPEFTQIRRTRACGNCFFNLLRGGVHDECEMCCFEGASLTAPSCYGCLARGWLCHPLPDNNRLDRALADLEAVWCFHKGKPAPAVGRVVDRCIQNALGWENSTGTALTTTVQARRGLSVSAYTGSPTSWDFVNLAKRRFHRNYKGVNYIPASVIEYRARQRYYNDPAFTWAPYIYTSGGGVVSDTELIADFEALTGLAFETSEQ